MTYDYNLITLAYHIHYIGSMSLDFIGKATEITSVRLASKHQE
jgi:hypothetical protein